MSSLCRRAGATALSRVATTSPDNVAVTPPLLHLHLQGLFQLRACGVCFQTVVGARNQACANLALCDALPRYPRVPRSKRSDKESDRLGGQEQCPPIGHLVASRCGSLDASARYLPLGVTAAIEKYRRRSLSAGRRCCVRMLRTSCSSPPPGARSCIHLADIMSSRE